MGDGVCIRPSAENALDRAHNSTRLWLDLATNYELVTLRLHIEYQVGREYKSAVDLGSETGGLSAENFLLFPEKWDIQELINSGSAHRQILLVYGVS